MVFNTIELFPIIQCYDWLAFGSGSQYMCIYSQAWEYYLRRDGVVAVN